MKRILAIILACCLAAMLTACGTGDLYLHDAEQTQAPAPAEATDAPAEEAPQEPDLDLGSPVIFNVQTNTETYYAPDDSGKMILSYGYNDVQVFLEDNPEAANQINQYLARLDEIYYSGSDSGSGVNAMLEQAIDNYGLAINSGLSTNTEFSSMRSVCFDRGDSRVIALRYRVNSFTGGTHSEYFDRAYNFDTASGALLTIDDIAADRAALEKAVLDRMHELIENDVRYQIISAYMKALNPDADVDEALHALIREGSWVFDNEGFTVFSDIYEIGSYADGIYRFTLAYDKLDGLIKDQYMPVERGGSGALMIRDLHGEDASDVRLIDKVTISKKGSDFRVYAKGTVYDVTIDSVTYINDDVGFYQTDSHWFCSYLSNAGVQVQTLIPEGMPNLMIRYYDAEGKVHSCLITQSGEDGSVTLIEEAKVEAVG